MSRYEMKLPDVGEGVAEAELVEWRVAVGDAVTADTVIAEVLTDKATIEISAPVAGTVAERHGEPGDLLAVGGALVVIETGAPIDAAPDESSDGDGDGEGDGDAMPAPAAPAEPAADSVPAEEPIADGEPVTPSSPAAESEPTVDAEPVVEAESAPRSRPTAAPAVRARAAALGIDLAGVAGSGPGGRVTHADLDRSLVGGVTRRSTGPAAARSDAGRREPVRGVRRQIAQRMTQAWSEIPHITYVDAVDATELERLRAQLNGDRRSGTHLTILPFIVRAVVTALADQPRLNAHYDHAAETLTVFDAVHVGIATQTDDGLRVPVVRHAEARDLFDLAAEIGRVSGAARDRRATREELTGSTVSITSLGPLGGLVTTPIINPPEVAIVGVNKLETRPVWRNGGFEPRQMLNVSASFDHRMVDGWDAATFVQRIARLVESPALLFLDGG